jgi:hypothetical protein
MVNTIEKAGYEDEAVNKCGYLKLVVDKIPPANWLSILQDLAPAKDQIQGIQFKRSIPGFVEVYTPEHSQFTGLDLLATETTHSPDDPKAYFQETIDSPPSGFLLYYIGPLLLEVPHNALVHPGERLMRRGAGALSGINTVYWYLSTCPLTPARLHLEDVYFPSVNLLLAGKPKFWLVFPPDSKTKLEDLIQRKFMQGAPCSQFVGHLGLLISP